MPLAVRLATEERVLRLLENVLSELVESDTLRNEFVALASHELRTPISVVHGIAATLHLRGDELQSEQIHELQEVLFEQTGRLRDLADQLLDLSRIDSQPLRVEPEPFHPRERLDELLPRIAAGRLDEIDVKVDPEHEVTTDAVAFERVAANLILNALRYGRPPVEVKAEHNHEYRLVVEDRGDGVAPEFVPRLFERFSRSDEVRRKGAPGAGLGLAIASAYARAVGGRLRYERARPRGARFTFTLPVPRT
jgi:signal transduction histidine kinase